MAGSSVDVSGERSWVSCESGYIVVFFPGDGHADSGGGAFISGVRMAVDCLMYCFG